MTAFTKQNIKTAVNKYVPMMLGLQIPGFIKIHLRYVQYNPLTWGLLFLVPFVLGGSSLSFLSEHIFEYRLSSLKRFLISLFIIALAFFLAERFRKFRRFYVYAIPGLLLLNGLFTLFILRGISADSVATFGILTALPTWLVGKHTINQGYKALSDGGDKCYRPGRDFYMNGQYDEAFALLEPSAKRGHMKSLYLLGHAHEHGNGRELDRVKAARFYDKSCRKNYYKAQPAFDRLLESFTSEEMDKFETDRTVIGISQLF